MSAAVARLSLPPLPPPPSPPPRPSLLDLLDDDMLRKLLLRLDLPSLCAAKATCSHLRRLAAHTLLSAAWRASPQNDEHLCLAGWRGGGAARLSRLPQHHAGGVNACFVSDALVVSGGATDGFLTVCTRRDGVEHSLRCRRRVLSLDVREDGAERLLAVGFQDGACGVYRLRLGGTAQSPFERAHEMRRDEETRSSRAYWGARGELVVSLEMQPGLGPAASLFKCWPALPGEVHSEVHALTGGGAAALDTKMEVQHGVWVAAIAVGEHLVACAMTDGSVELWASSGAFCRTVGHRAAAYALAVRGWHTFSGGDDQTLRVHRAALHADAATLHCSHWAVHAHGRLRALASTPALLVGGGVPRECGHVCVWVWSLGALLSPELSKGALLARLCDAPTPGFDGLVRCVSMTNDTIVCGADDGVVRLWRLGPIAGQTADSPTGRTACALKSEKLGVAEFRRGCFASALHLFSAGIDVEPNAAELRVYRAMTLMALGRPNEAVADLLESAYRGFELWATLCAFGGLMAPAGAERARWLARLVGLASVVLLAVFSLLHLPFIAACP
ncbi:hypothetical protein AB1Y20_011045 [Prymnesium parvum]|uniref:F-box domain-containing protein n=1 Tax=Prymnesium parvum TaxID=97485 RepID=A0AB34INC2_PRYPA